MRNTLVITLALASGISVGWFLKNRSTVVMSQPEPSQVPVVASVTTQKPQPRSVDDSVTGRIDSIGFGDQYVPQPVEISSDRVVAGVQNPNNQPTQ
jgi:uncharacterized protein YaaQ